MRRAAAVAVAVTLAGCGGGEDEGERAPSAEAVRVAERCDLGRPQRGTPPGDLFPARLLPSDAIVFRWEGSGLAARARVVIPAPLGRSQRAVDQNAQALGFPVLFRETEVFDAELDVQSGGEVLRFAFAPSRGCRDVTVAAVRKLAAPG